MSECLIGAARRVSARQPSSFWLDPKGTKRSSPDAQPLGFAKGSPALLACLGRPETRCAHCVRSAQTVGPSMKRTRAGARCPAKLRCSAAHRGSSPNSRTANSREMAHRWQSGLFGIRLLAVGGLPYAKPRSTEEWARARSARRALTWRNCLNGVSNANAVSFAPGPLFEHHREPQPQAGAQASGSPFFSPLFFGEAKKRGSGAGVKPLRALRNTRAPG